MADYSWLQKLELSPLPQWIIDKLAPKETKAAPTFYDAGATVADQPIEAAKGDGDRMAAYGAAAMEREIAALTAASEGTRNHTLNRCAFNLFQIVAAGHLADADVTGALTNAGLQIGLTDKEITKTLKSARDKARPRVIKDRPLRPATERMTALPADTVSKLVHAELTDVGNAECFVEMYADDFRYDHTTQIWRMWDGERWAPDTRQVVRTMAIDIVRARGAAVAASQLPREEKDRRIKWCLRCEMVPRINALLDIVRADSKIATTITDYDGNPMVACAGSQTLELAEGNVLARDNARADLITKRIGAMYDPEADCPTWRKFLADVFENDQDVIDYVQRIAGYSLHGRRDEQVFIMCHGQGSNGKSTFLEVLRTLMGDYGGTTPFRTFEAESSEARQDLAKLRATRLVTISEADENVRLAEGRIKAITGKEAITARELYGKSFDYVPTFLLLIALNHLPVIRGTDDGIWRRVQLLPFSRQFKESEKDKRMEEKLLGELPGILNWALEGLMNWHAVGLAPPLRVTQRTAEYRDQSDVVGQWIKDRCTVGQSFTVRAKTGYESYAQWAKDSGMQSPLTMQSWSRKLTDRGFVRQRDSFGIFYLGIGVLEQDK